MELIHLRHLGMVLGLQQAAFAWRPRPAARRPGMATVTARRGTRVTPASGGGCRQPHRAGAGHRRFL